MMIIMMMKMMMMIIIRRGIDTRKKLHQQYLDSKL